MSVDLIRYDLLVQDALRGVVGRVLTDVAREGLPGEHHLYLAFDTCAPGVRISPRLKERYPEEMTIVLQHQFWDLIVTEQFFEVGLSFNGIPEKLHVPFDALKGFFDPSVKFGLQFEPVEDLEDEDEDEAADAAGPTLTSVPPTPIGEGRPTSVPSTRAPSRLADVSAKGRPASFPKPESVAEPEKPASAKPAVAKPAAVTPAAANPDGAKPDAAKLDAAKPTGPVAVPAAKAPPTAAPAATRTADTKTAAAKPSEKPSDKSSDAKPGPKEVVDAADPKDGGSGGAQVVRLDSFRKK